jgi:uncharacterized protein YlaI
MRNIKGKIYQFLPSRMSPMKGEHKKPKRIDCFICGKENLTRNEIGLNKKLLGKEIRNFHCLGCLSDYLEIPVEDLVERIQEFKDSGCVVFE